MASPNSSFGDLATTTLANYSGKMADNVSEGVPLLKFLKESGNIYPADGGTKILQELEYAENTTFAWYSGAELLNISPSETFTAAEYDWKQANCNVVFTGLDAIKNRGKAAVHNLLKSRIRNAEKTMMNNLGDGVYNDGTTDTKAIGGLRLIVADAPTNTVGGISATTYSWWANQVWDISSDGGTTASSTTIQAQMESLWLECTRGSDMPNMITADDDYYKYYWQSLTSLQRFTSEKKAALGFLNLAFHGNCPVIYDEQCPDAHMYFLNTNYLFLRPSPEKNMTPGKAKESVNQDAVVIPVYWAGNLTCSNRSLQGVIIA